MVVLFRSVACYALAWSRTTSTRHCGTSTVLILCWQHGSQDAPEVQPVGVLEPSDKIVELLRVAQVPAAQPATEVLAALDQGLAVQQQRPGASAQHVLHCCLDQRQRKPGEPASVAIGSFSAEKRKHTTAAAPRRTSSSQRTSATCSRACEPCSSSPAPSPSVAGRGRPR